MFARVAILTERGALAETYTYRIPLSLEGLQPGYCVVVPFQTQVRFGYVCDVQAATDIAKTRDILGRYEKGDLPPSRVKMAEWMADYWFSGIASCLRLMMPPASRGRIIRKASVTENTSSTLTNAAQNIFDFLTENGATTIASITRKFGKPRVSRAFSELRKAGLLQESYDIASAAGSAKYISYYAASPDKKTEEWLDQHGRRKRKQAALLRWLIQEGEPRPLSDIGGVVTHPSPTLRTLVNEGLVEITQKRQNRRGQETSHKFSEISLTFDQKSALSTIEPLVKDCQFSESLIFGVTASGKTEVYLRLIEAALAMGKSAMVLMPEIALTVHAVGQYRERFGQMLAVLHSKLTSGERVDEWDRIVSEEAVVVLGPRSAVFAPLNDIGVIIIDEEHEGAFKQDSEPRYHARDVARHLAQKNGCPLVLGSATPSIESYHQAKEGEIKLIEMPRRVIERAMPYVRVVDMREYSLSGELSIFSPELKAAMAEVVNNKGQVILFLNRRAYGTFVMCRDCGFVSTCPNCAVVAKYHRTDMSVRCHHCEWKSMAPPLCPDCGSMRITSFGIGTQKVEEELFQYIDEARILRMDQDTTSGKDTLVGILERFRAKEADVLIGTQMVAKGLDFPDVQLVGVINADTGLQMPDYRAAERGFQILAQVAGRTGRGEKAGEVIIQTFQPTHYAIAAASRHDYPSFYAEEIAIREECDWPPFSALARVLVQHLSEAEARRIATRIADKLRQSEAVDLIGPSSAPIERIKQRFRWHFVLRAERRSDLLALLRENEELFRPTEITVDVDPSSLL